MESHKYGGPAVLPIEIIAFAVAPFWSIGKQKVQPIKEPHFSTIQYFNQAFFAAFTFAHLALAARLIRARPAALILRLAVLRAADSAVGDLPALILAQRFF